MKPQYYIGIDPDVTASGICVWNAKMQSIEILACKPLFCKQIKGQCIRDGLLSSLLHYSSVYRDQIHVIIDAGWLNRTNFHSRANESHKANAIIGERIGANHEVGKKIAEMCEYLGISYDLHRPSRSKITADYFKHLTGYKLRTNQDMRDAAILVYGK